MIIKQTSLIFIIITVGLFSFDVLALQGNQAILQYQGEYSTGSIKVLMEPPEARIAGAGWKPAMPGIGDGNWIESGVTLPGFDPGPMLIEFNPIFGWVQPQKISVNVEQGKTVSLTAVYKHETGSISVTIHPDEANINGKWSVYIEGKGWSDWKESEEIVPEVRTGSTSIKFLPISDWIEPPEKTVYIKASESIVKTGTYEMRTGSLKVKIMPDEAINAGAGWRVKNTDSWLNKGDICPGLAVGNNVIEFKTVEGWEKPPDMPVIVVENETLEIVGIYEKLKGSLNVIIFPYAVVNEGAKWRIDGGLWHESNKMLSDLPVGPYMLEFNIIPGWYRPYRPLNKEVIIEANKTNGILATYIQQIKKPIIRIEPTAVTIDQNEAINYELPAGKWMPFFENASKLPQVAPDFGRIQSDQNILKAKLITTGMFFENQEENGENYQVIHLGKYNGDLAPGYPNLPVIRRYLYIPKGKSADIQVNLNEKIDFKDYLIYPIQKSHSDLENAENSFYADESIYKRDEWFPKQNVYLGNKETIRGHTVRLINICPFQYNPARRVLRAYPEIEVQVNFNGQIIEMDSRVSSPVFDRFIKGFVFNSDAMGPFQLSLDNGFNNENPGLYLIIVSPEFAAQANTLGDAKKARGMETIVKTTDETGASKAQIKDYLKNAYNTWPVAPTCVLLFGDVETIPTTYETSLERGTDLYYSTLDGEDIIPDIFLGRISVDTVSEADVVIKKILDYENNPPPVPPFYSNAAIAAYFQDNDNDGFADRRFVRTSEEIRDYMLSKGYNAKRLYCTNSAAPTNYNNGIYGNGEPLPDDLLMSDGFEWDAKASDISAAINNGIFLLIHRDHGMDRNSGFEYTGWEHPDYVETDIPNLNNGSLLPVVMSINCQSGWFDGETDHYPDINYESFCELFLREEKGGTVGIFGSTRDSYSGYNDGLLSGLIDCVWPDFLPDVPNHCGASSQLGQILVHGKLVMDQIWGNSDDKRREQYELFHVFGDPSLEMWTFNPYSQSENFTIYNDGGADLIITSMTKQDNDPWLDFTPKAPFTILPGKSKVISITIDWTKIDQEINEDQIIVESNDTNSTPYPKAVYITANKSIKKYNLELSKKGNGRVKINDMLYELPLELQFYENETVNIEAIPDDDWEFENWSVDSEIKTDHQIEIVMDADKIITANFIFPIQTYVLTLLKEGHGIVKINGIPYALPLTYSFEQGAGVELEALPSDDFLNWTEDLDGNENPITIEMDEDKYITSVFKTLPIQGWQTEIHAEGAINNALSYYEDDYPGYADQIVNSCKVTIGIAKEAHTEEPPPLPPEYSVKMQLYTSNWDGPFIKDIRQEGLEIYQWVIEINSHGNMMPSETRTTTLSWDASTFSPDGFYQLIKVNCDGNRKVVVPDMRVVEEYKVTGENVSQFYTLEYGYKTTAEMNLKRGWNLISLPVIPDDSSLATLFPDAIAAFEFDGGYKQAELLTPGTGYWIDIPADMTYKITGENFTSYTKSLSKGWHLIGAVNGTDIPECEDAISVIYGFDELYYQYEELTGGKGYWVNILNECEFILQISR